MPAYNVAINETRQQLLLLNIVRLRYSESPYLIEVSNIFAAPNYTATADVGGTFGSNFNDISSAKAELTYGEAPVIVYTPVGGEQLSRRLLQPVGLNTLGLLTRAGWDLDRIMRLCVQEINDVWNAESATGPMASTTTPEYTTFRRVVKTMHELESKRLMDFPVLQYTDDDQGVTSIPGRQDNFVAHQMVIKADARSLPQVRQLMTDLNLDPQADSYYITESWVNEPNQTIRIITRPIMTTLHYLSLGVKVPQQDIDNEVVRVTRDKEGEAFDRRNISDDLFTIESSASKPADAFLAVQYRDHWFYIRDNDVVTKDTFVLIETLLALRAGEIPQSNTPLTLPVR